MAAPFIHNLGNYDVGAEWHNGVNIFDDWCTFFAGGSLEDQLDSTHLEMIMISENGGAVMQADDILTISTFHYIGLDGTTDTEISVWFGYPDKFRILLSSDSTGEWDYYNEGGSFPWTPPPTITKVRTVSISYL